MKVVIKSVCVFLLGVLATYVCVLIYNLYWQPVVFRISDQFRGVIVLEFQPRSMAAFLPRRKSFLIIEDSIIVCYSLSPYEVFSETKAQLTNGRKIPVYDQSDLPLLDCTEGVGFFIIDLLPDQARFVVGNKQDAERAFADYGKLLRNLNGKNKGTRTNENKDKTKVRGTVSQDDQ